MTLFFLKKRSGIYGRDQIMNMILSFKFVKEMLMRWWSKVILIVCDSGKIMDVSSAEALIKCNAHPNLLVKLSGENLLMLVAEEEDTPYTIEGGGVLRWVVGCGKRMVAGDDSWVLGKWASNWPKTTLPKLGLPRMGRKHGLLWAKMTGPDYAEREAYLGQQTN